MEISSEDYIKERNEETAAIKDMTIEQIKARITDYELQRIKLRARQQSCFAVLQEDEKRRSVANEMKNIINKETLVNPNDVLEAKAEEAKKVQSKLDKQVESWRKMGIAEDTVRKMARMIEPHYRFDGEKDVKKYFLTCSTHGKFEITRAQYDEQQKQSNGWTCTQCENPTVFEATTEIVDTNK